MATSRNARSERSPSLRLRLSSRGGGARCVKEEEEEDDRCDDDGGGGRCNKAAAARRLLQQLFDRLFKLVMIGNSGVGKTSFLTRYAGGDFSPAYRSTVGIDFKMKTVERNSRRLKLQIWDTSGQERFQAVTTAYYRGAMGFVIMYDVTDEQSFLAVETWLSHVHNKCDMEVPVVLVANKIDAEKGRTVSAEAGLKMAERLGFSLFEASAKDDVNVEAAFDCVVDRIFDKMASEAEHKETCDCKQCCRDEESEEEGGCCRLG